MNGDGSGQTRVTNNGATEQDLDWGPYGYSIVRLGLIARPLPPSPKSCMLLAIHGPSSGEHR